MKAGLGIRGAIFAAACISLAIAASAATGSTGAGGKGSGPTAHISVIGGQPAPIERFPWMAFVFDELGDEASSCSGSVVAPTLVLTAAHCVVNLETGATNEASGFHVVTGSADWTAPGSQVSEVSLAIPFRKGFRLDDSSLGYGDAALLVLTTPTTAPPISLATRTESKRLLRTGTHALIAGWGDARFGQSEPSPSLLWAKTVIEGTNCEGLFGRVCAIDFPKATSGVCHGDSGGPLLANGRRGQGLIQIAIAQAIFGKCSTRRPGVFMRTDLILPWVRRHISKLGGA